MAKPPMPDTITINRVKLDVNGNPVENRYGQPEREAATSKARVKYSAERVLNSRGEETTATLEIFLPPEQMIHAGDVIDWVDRTGMAVSGPVVKLKEVLSYSGTVVYYRKVWTV